MARLVAMVAASIVLWSPAWLPAQDFQKIEGKLTQDVSSAQFVGIAYAFIWSAVLLYVVFVTRGLARVSSELAELRRELKAGAGEEQARTTTGGR